MNGRHILEALSFIEEAFVEEAERETIPRRSIPIWTRTVAAAACLCIMLSGIYVLRRDRYGSTEVTPAAPEAPAAQAPEEPAAQGAPLAPPGEQDVVPAEGAEQTMVTVIRILSWEEDTITGIVEDPGSGTLGTGQEVTVLVEPQEDTYTRGMEKGLAEVYWRSMDEETMTIRALKVILAEEGAE